MAQKSYKLFYFPARGRGEFIRLAFIIAGVEFEDCRIEKETWATLKAGEFWRDLKRVQNVLVWFCLHTTDTIKMKLLNSWFKHEKAQRKKWDREQQASRKLNIKLQTHSLLNSRGKESCRGEVGVETP